MLVLTPVTPPSIAGGAAYTLHPGSHPNPRRNSHPRRNPRPRSNTLSHSDSESRVLPGATGAIALAFPSTLAGKPEPEPEPHLLCLLLTIS